MEQVLFYTSGSMFPCFHFNEDLHMFLLKLTHQFFFFFLLPKILLALQLQAENLILFTLSSQSMRNGTIELTTSLRIFICPLH